MGYFNKMNNERVDDLKFCEANFLVVVTFLPKAIAFNIIKFIFKKRSRFLLLLFTYNNGLRWIQNKSGRGG